MTAPGPPHLPPQWTREVLAKRRARALATGLLLGGLVILILLVTIVKLGGNVGLRDI